MYNVKYRRCNKHYTFLNKKLGECIKMANYNGWKNWETWSCKLWFDEDGTTNWYYDYVKENNTSVEYLAEMLENELYDKYEEQIQTGFFSDIVGHAIREVDFIEIDEAIKESIT